MSHWALKLYTSVILSNISDPYLFMVTGTFPPVFSPLAGKSPTGKRPSKEKTGGEKTGGEKTGGEKNAGKRPSGEKT